MIKVPHHLAIIMDGNRRWARQRGLPSVSGHREGSETLKKIARHASERDVRWLTAFAFSFDEGNEKVFLEINSKFGLKEIDDNKFLTQVSKIDTNNYFYRLTFENKKELDNTMKALPLDDDQISYDIRYS